MSRWEPNARERLERAALESFLQHGYDSTTVAEIAERAGLTKRTFFRHFTDKPEVLFHGQNILIRLVDDAISGAPESATPMEAVAAALQATAAAFRPERHEPARQRQAVVEGNDELRERELLKMAAITATMTDALTRHGVTEPTASLAAELGSLAFRMSFVRWIEPARPEPFAEIARRTLEELREANAALR